MEFLWLELYRELDVSDGSQDDVPRQWHLRGARGDGDSTYRNEERIPMVFAFTSGSNYNLHFFSAMSFETEFMVRNGMVCLTFHPRYIKFALHVLIKCSMENICSCPP